MTQRSKRTMGIDVGDKQSHFCVLGDEAEIVKEGRFRTTPEGLRRLLADYAGIYVAFETGSHALWIRREIEAAGATPIEGNPREIRLIYHGRTKNDRLDAEKLARLARTDVKLLKPIEARDAQTQTDLLAIKARDQLVASRTALVNFVRGAIKPFGVRLPSGPVETLPKRAREHLPPEVLGNVQPVLGTIEDLGARIRMYDRAIEKVAAERYPVTEHLRQIRGVGPLTSLVYLLVIGNPDRFSSSRSVGAYLGLTPRQDQSGDQDLALGITKAGSPMLRRLLLQCAHYILGPFGEDCDLRRYGERIAARGGKVAKRKAVVAVARKLAVLLHRLWVTGEVYDPLREARRRGELEGEEAAA